MRTVRSIFTLLIVAAVFSCSRVELVGPLEVTGVPITEIHAILRKRNVDSGTIDLISRDLSSVYSYVTIRIFEEDGVMHLSVDQFNYDEWSNPTTGETGRAPHGSKTDYVRTRGDWKGTKVVHYGG